MALKLLKDLNSAQRQAVSFGEGPLLILAGAGSGKTRALTYRAAYLIKEKGIKPNRILLVTFTNKAAEEMKQRVKKIIGPTALPWAGTYHAFCSRLLRAEGKHLGIEPDFAIYDETDSLEAIKQAMQNLKISESSYSPAAVRETISQAKNELISAMEYPQYARGHFQETVSQIFLEYQRLLKLYHALDFDDLLFEAVRLLQKEARVREKYQQQFYYVLVDEYQDTNRAQYILSKTLAAKWRNLCVVGDASQSIYSWRGADYRNLINLKADFPNLTIINLEQNYRSTKNILEAANQVIEKNTLHPILKLWTKIGRGEKVTVYEALNEKDEVEFIIKKLLEGKPTIKADLKNQAILYRTNAQSRVIEEGLIKAGLSYVLIGGTRFYGRKEIKDCLAFLRYLVNPRDNLSYKRIEKLGKTRLSRFLDWAKIYTKGKKKLTAIEVLDQILKVIEYQKLFAKKNEQAMMRWENIQELRSVAAEFKDLRQFLEKVALVEQTDFLPERPIKNGQKLNAVTLMTLHASKGLEFKRVFMIGLEEGLFPHARSLLDREALEEERRLCYVGMTRAKRQLCLSYARKRLYFGRQTRNLVSRFLSEIDNNLLQWLKNEKMI
jgi:DNA helicase-2/ATP-dependent DNA helicase PcrA